MQRLILPFIAGFLAVLFFQQSTIALLHAANLTAKVSYDVTDAITPMGVPRFLVDALAGGAWGIVLAWLLGVAPHRPAPWVGALMFGGVVLTAAAIFIIGPIQGQWPTGNILPRVAFGFVSNAVWGWGALVFMRAFMMPAET